MVLGNKFKKGQIATTLTWVVATLIVFFVMMIFILASLTLAGKKKITFEDNQASLEGYSVGSLDLQRELDRVLRKRIEFGNGNARVGDLVYVSDKLEREELGRLKEGIEKAMDERFPRGSIIDEYIWAISIDKGEENILFSGGRCALDSSIWINVDQEIADKKIVLCFWRNDFLKLKEEGKI